MLQPVRKFAAADLYRYGFNGKENDNDVKGEGNQQDYGMRVYDSRLGRFLSEDPITADYPELTPYQFASNRPSSGIDQDGMEFAGFMIYMWSKSKGQAVQKKVNSGHTTISPGFQVHYNYKNGKAEFRSEGPSPFPGINNYLHVGNTRYFLGNDNPDLAAQEYNREGWPKSQVTKNVFDNSTNTIIYEPGNQSNESGGFTSIYSYDENTASKNRLGKFKSSLSGVALGFGLSIANPNFAAAEGSPGYVPGPSITALRKVGSVLESVDDVMANPSLLKRMSPLHVEGIIGKTPGWRIESLRKGSKEGQGWVLRMYNANGNPTGQQIRWHPGGGHHGTDPYWRVVGPNGDLGGIIR